MATRLDIARRLYRQRASSQLSDVGAVSGGQSGSLAMRYGTATADSSGGRVSVRLDTSSIDDGSGDDAPIVSCICDTPISEGQRVSVLTTSDGQLKAIPIGDNILNEANEGIEQSRNELAQQIKDEGQAILDEVNGEMDEWKADHQLTDADIQHSIEQSVRGATETWEGQLSSVENDIETNYALKTEVSQGIDGLRSEISETYATSDGVTNEINTAIEQASGEISSTVEQNVMNSVGETFATKTELTQTEQDLTLTISQSVANGYATCQTSAATRAKVATCANQNFSLKQGFTLSVRFTYANTASSPTLNVNGTGARTIYLGSSTVTSDVSWDAGDTVLFVYDGSYWRIADAAMRTAKTVESYFIADSTGLTIGQSGEDSAVKMNSDGKFQVLNGGSSVLDIGYDRNYGAMIESPIWDSIGIRNRSSSLFLISSDGYSFSSMGGGFSVNTIRAVEVFQYEPSSGTGSVTISTVPSGVVNLQYVCIYYHNTYDGNRGSIKLHIARNETKTADMKTIANDPSLPGILGCTETVTVSVSSNETVTIRRAQTGRFSLGANVYPGVNNNAGSIFNIDRVTLCY